MRQLTIYGIPHQISRCGISFDKEEESKRKTDQIFLTKRGTDLDKEDKEEEMWKKLREPFTNFNWDSMKLELARHHHQTFEKKFNRFVVKT